MQYINSDKPISKSIKTVSVTYPDLSNNNNSYATFVDCKLECVNNSIPNKSSPYPTPSNKNDSYAPISNSNVASTLCQMN